MWALIENALQKQGITIYRMSKDLNIPVNTIYSWRTMNKIPKTDDVVSVFRYLSIDLRKLLEV